MVKLGLVNAFEPIDIAETQKLESVFAEPLSVGFQDPFPRQRTPG